MSCSPGYVLARSFYERPATEVARALLGQVLVHSAGSTTVAARIVETEAYLGVGDRAAHAWRGPTPRTRVLFGPAGHVYVYLIYGMYECLNIVAEPAGTAGCVLIRALEPLDGVEHMRRRRPAARSVEELANGPGKLTIAMGITRKHNGADLTKGPLTVHEGSKGPLEVGVGPRIGIKHCADWPLRFFLSGNRFLSR